MKPQPSASPSGSRSQTFRCPPQVPYYLGSSWRGQLELSGNLEEAKGVQMQPQQAQPERMHRQLCISIQLTCDCSLEVFLYSPYWVINKTGLPLQIRVR